MCFVHKHRQYADFGQILCRHASTKRHMTLMVWFSQLGVKRCVRLERKNLMKRRVAICGGRQALADFVQGGGGGGGGGGPPPPPPQLEQG